MPQDTSLYNNNLLSNDTLCHFQDFIGRQDEVPEIFFKNKQLKYTEIGRSDSNIIVQRKTGAYQEIEFFSTNQFKTSTTDIEHRKNETYDAVSLLLFISVALYVIAQFFYYPKIKSIFQISFSYKKNIQQLSSEKLQISLGGIVLAFLYYISIGLSVIQILSFFFKINVVASFLELFAVIVVSILVYKIIVLFIQLIVSVIFEIVEDYRLLLKKSISIQSLIGLFLLPLNIVVAYTQQNYFLYLSIAILIALSIYRFVRGVYLFKRAISFSWFHIILYFCISEILPLLILVKIGIKFISIN